MMVIDYEVLKYNAALQRKKNALRADLAKRGVQKRAGTNTFDRYTYFSEAQYKALFTELFSIHMLELKFNEIEYAEFEGTDKMPFGRKPRIEFELIDVETGYSERTVITGEGIDKGDKAGYKAYTGALKYYLANTFLVATGDDPEKDSTEGTPKRTPATAEQIRIITELATAMPERVGKMLEYYDAATPENLTVQQASAAIKKLRG